MMLNQTIVLFAGTSEGRTLAERCAAAGRKVIVCVATEYGEKLLPEHPSVSVHQGRMDEQQMRDFLKEQQPELVIDATHPYARLVSETVRQVCEELQIEYMRLIREQGADIPENKHVHVVDDAPSAAALAEQLTGNIFLTTGSRELAVFARTVSDFSRLYARVLSTEDTFEICRELGFEGKQLICMQGPFSEELNRAMYVHTDAKILVTKESGDAGGFLSKLGPALSLGMHCIVIKRPTEQGVTYAQVCARLGITEAKDGCLTLVGIGMGTPLYMTREAGEALGGAQVIFGAERMLETVRAFPAEKVCEYRREEILEYLRTHPQITRAAVAFSGDVGFYSGADGFQKKFILSGRQWQVRRIAGISSVNYLAAKLGVAWQDIKLCSAHGRQTDLLTQISRNRRVFSLLNGGGQLTELARSLAENGLGHVRVAAGFDLGYDTEEIRTGKADEFQNDPVRNGLCAALFENEHARAMTSGNLPDTAFLRGSVPLTKEEIRAVALSKLRLTSDAVCYDIGAGTGGMTVDMARFVPEGSVIAFERNREACELIRENARRRHCGNIEVVQGSAPDILSGYQPPTHAFIGGSGGRMQEIAACLLEKNPAVRVVIDAITLETVSEANALLKTLPVTDVDIISVTVAKAKQAGSYQLMESMNPVYIFSFTGDAQR